MSDIPIITIVRDQGRLVHAAIIVGIALLNDEHGFPAEIWQTKQNIEPLRQLWRYSEALNAAIASTTHDEPTQHQLDALSAEVPDYLKPSVKPAHDGAVYSRTQSTAGDNTVAPIADMHRHFAELTENLMKADKRWQQLLSHVVFAQQIADHLNVIQLDSLRDPAPLQNVS